MPARRHYRVASSLIARNLLHYRSVGIGIRPAARTHQRVSVVSSESMLCNEEDGAQKSGVFERIVVYNLAWGSCV